LALFRALPGVVADVPNRGGEAIVDATEGLYQALFGVAIGYGVISTAWGVAIAPFNRYDQRPVASVLLGVALLLAWVPVVRGRRRIFFALRAQPAWLLVFVALGAGVLWADSGWRSVFYLASYSAIPLAAVACGMRWSVLCGALLALHYFTGLAIHGWAWGQPGAFKETDSAIANTGGYLIAGYFLAVPVAWLGRYVSRISLELSGTTPEVRKRLKTRYLTVRETEVVQLVADGLSNEQIAAKLKLSTRTVQSHVANALAKTGAPTRTSLAVLALREGIVPLVEATPEAPQSGHPA
jgi:DNA-binding CsgD family transcriptional regulator